MAADSTVFNFDVSPFLSGLKRVGDGMDRMSDKARSMGQVVTRSVGSALNGLILKVGGLFAAFKGLGAVLREMPEVGEAFGIAKDVFLKNLLWPLRQQVMPMLQGLLDWTRDNRAQFVRWGVAVANVFSSVVVSARVLWDVFKGLVETVAGAFQRAFHTNFKSFDEFVNVLSFKVSAVVIFIGMLAEELTRKMAPALEWVIETGASVLDFFVKLGGAWLTANKNGDSLWTVFDKIKGILVLVADAVRAAWEGFKEGFLSSSITEAMTPITKIADSFERILKALGLGDTDGVRGAFKALGSFLGTAFQATLVVVAELLSGIAGSLETIKDAKEALELLFKGDTAGAKALGGKILKDTSKGGTKSLGEAYNVFTGESIDDGIVTKDGKVVRISPQDNVLAFKSLPALGALAGGGTGDVSVGPFYVTVTEGDARSAGESFGRGLAESFRDRVSRARNAEGY
jgi:phage-related protein